MCTFPSTNNAGARQAVIAAQQQDPDSVDKPQITEECRAAVEQVLNGFAAEEEVKAPKKARKAAAAAPGGAAAAASAAAITKPPTYAAVLMPCTPLVGLLWRAPRVVFVVG